MNRLLFLIVFLAGCCAPPAPTVDPVQVVEVVGPLTVEGKSSCAVGESIELRAKGDATWVDWASESPHLGPYETGRIVTFSSPTAGRHVFWLFGDVGGKPAKVKHVVTVGTPGPGPGPVPPGPTVPPVVTPPVVIPDPTVRPSRATYVYEQRSGPVPPPVLAALDKLNRAGIVATAVDQNVISGKGQIPIQYTVALDAAKKAGIPCLVVEFASGPPRVVKVTTAAQVEEAVR